MPVDPLDDHILDGLPSPLCTEIEITVVLAMRLIHVCELTTKYLPEWKMTQTPTLTQVQIIQSLAEALSWMEKETSWGVAMGELNHLTGRIGELYAAMITRGQMALATNQQGYDVVSAANERISVKCVTSSSHVSFNQNTFHLVDRVIVLRIVNDADTGLAVEELLDCSASDAKERMRSSGTKLIYSTTAAPTRTERPLEDLAVTGRAFFREWELRKFESGAIRVFIAGVLQPVIVKDVLRVIAPEVGVEVVNAAGSVKTTHQLGSEIIRALESISSGQMPGAVPTQAI